MINNNNIFIPYPIINVILEYMSGLNNLKWNPVVDINTGNLTWNINKYNSTTTKIKKMLKFKCENPPFLIPVLCDYINCLGRLTLLEKDTLDCSRFYQCKYLLEYDRHGFAEEAILSIWKDKENSQIIPKKYNNYLFRDYLPDPSFWITSIKDVIWNDYGITLIINDHIDSWIGVWDYFDNEWRFVIDIPQELLEEEENEWDDDYDP